MKHPELGTILFDSQKIEIPREYYYVASGERVSILVQYAFHVNENRVTMYDYSGNPRSMGRINFSRELERYLETQCLIRARQVFNISMKPESVRKVVEVVNRIDCVTLAEQRLGAA